MLHFALAGRAHYEVDGQEITRGGVSYTMETVRNYRRRLPQARIFWLIGADHVAKLPLWRDAEELAAAVEFLVIPRPGEPAVPFPSPFRGSMLQGFPLGVSSSQIRARVKAGLPVDLLTGSAVAEAIHANRLYL